MNDFTPNYQNIVNAAKNKTAVRIPLYEHGIAIDVMEKIMNKKFADPSSGNLADKTEFFKDYCNFFKLMGYDTVSFEQGISEILPGGGALGSHKQGVIKTREDFEKYPWEQLPRLFMDKYSENFSILRKVMPGGMKAIGGPGYGLFECVQDLTGYIDLCYISVDDPELYADLFKTMGKAMYDIWFEFLKNFGDIYCVCRFGDDLGFKSNTLIAAEDIREYIIPQYKNIIEMIHSYQKPFLYHSCGKIFDVMEDIISIAKIDCKHSNEDQIAPFSTWVDKYGDRIGNFGGVDMDHLCRKSEKEIKEIVRDVMAYSRYKGGFAIGSGNSIPSYVPVEGYLAMIEAARKFRGEY